MKALKMKWIWGKNHFNPVIVSNERSGTVFMRWSVLLLQIIGPVILSASYESFNKCQQFSLIIPFLNSTSNEKGNFQHSLNIVEREKKKLETSIKSAYILSRSKKNAEEKWNGNEVHKFTVKMIHAISILNKAKETFVSTRDRSSSESKTQKCLQFDKQNFVSD